MSSKHDISHLITRRSFLAAVSTGTLLTLYEVAEPQNITDKDQALIPLRSDGFPPEIIPAPQDSAKWPDWQNALFKWRSEAKKKLNYDDALYRRPDFAWTSHCYACCFLMLNDERFIDAANGLFRVEHFLDVEEEKFGGYDAVVLWQAYPRIGLDDRNQFDFYREMPGGIKGMKDVIRRFHDRGIKAFLCYNPWDKGTRLSGEEHFESLIKMVGDLQADGIFLDTMDKASRNLRKELDAVRQGVALESEIALPLPNIHDHHLSWMQWWSDYDSNAPGVLRNKWFEQRHMQHQIRRWNTDHSSELQTAWMNGSGMMIWENVFGQWVAWNQRDKSFLRAMLPIQRKFTALFSGDDWLPLVPTEKPDIFASQWGKDDLRLWTLINRSEKSVNGTIIVIDAQPGQQFFDLITGIRIDDKISNNRRILKGTIPPRGIGCFLAASLQKLPSDFESFLTSQRKIFNQYSSDSTSVMPTAVRLPHQPTKPFIEPPQDMVKVPAANLSMQAEFQVREVGFYQPCPDRPIAGPWLNEKITFTRKVSLTDFAMDKTPVTNRQFAEFLSTSHYKPQIPDNFLKHWKDKKIPPGLEDHPVVYITIEDAKAYANWAGKRLPTEDQWQYAAQGYEALKYPWGNQDDPNRRNGGQTGTTTPVKAFPNGCSSFGVYDMCGNVWELTESRHSDGHNRFLMLKGGSYYKAKGSLWYFDGGPQTNQHTAKMLLFWPAIDRCATVGFRCVVDLAPTTKNET